MVCRLLSSPLSLLCPPAMNCGYVFRLVMNGNGLMGNVRDLEHQLVVTRQQMLRIQQGNVAAATDLGLERGYPRTEVDLFRHERSLIQERARLLPGEGKYSLMFCLALPPQMHLLLTGNGKWKRLQQA